VSRNAGLSDLHFNRITLVYRFRRRARAEARRYLGSPSPFATDRKSTSSMKR
jgi:hypothetical protein